MYGTLNSDGDFHYNLKLPSSDGRSNSDGNLNPTLTGNSGYIWSIYIIGSQTYRLVYSNSSALTIGASNRAIGISVRCTKD